VTATDAETSEDMANEQRTANIWMTLVTILWVALGLGVVVLILWWGGIIGGGNGNGTETTVSETSGDNGADSDQSDDGGDAADEDNGDAVADDEGDSTGNGEGDGEAEVQSIFTAEQAERGQEEYSANCAQCHGGQLDGDPPLTGQAFSSTWEGMPVNALFEVISQTMPQDSPGSLSDETYADITAHILAFNGMPEGEDELQPGDDEALQTLIFLDPEAGDSGNGDGEETGGEADSDDGDSAENGSGYGQADDGEDADSGDSDSNGDSNGEQAESDSSDGAADDADSGDDGNGNGGDADSGDGASDGEGWYTEEQAEAGAEDYSASCASCHGEDGTGGSDPELAGGALEGSFDTVWDLFDYTSTEMPDDDPGSLDEETYVNIVAHLLALNDFPAGDEELEVDEEQMSEMSLADGDGGGNGDGNGESADGDDADGADGGGNGDSSETDGDGGDTANEDANGEENNGDSADNGTQENGEVSAADATHADEDHVEQIDTEQPGDSEEPEAGEGWIEFTVRPQQATINILGPGGYVAQVSGEDEGTITGLEPGHYILAASLGNFDHQVVADVRQRETVRVELIIPALADSADLSGSSQDAGNGDSGSGYGQADDGEDADSGDSDSNGDSNGEQAESDSSDGAADDADSGDDGNGNGGDADSGDGASDGEGWYTEEQAEAGAEDYSASCASCHGEDGTGGSDPELAGGALEGSFDTVWDLFDYTSTEMPDDDPGSLDEETYVNIVAHLLALNDFPAGDEELEVDEEQMSEMSLADGDGGGNGDGNGESADGDDADGADGGGNGDSSETDGDGGDTANGEETGNGQSDNGDAQQETAAQRGQSAYSSNCAMCHGPSLEGIEAPPLAGPVFMERWGGHPVNWLYFQAYTSMPPDTPGSLDDQAYTDIMVHILTENGLLEGDEEFRPYDPLLEMMIIGTQEQQDFTLQHRIEELRRTVHEPFEEAEQEDPETGADETGIPPAETSDSPAEDGPRDPLGGNGGEADDNGNGNSAENGAADNDVEDEGDGTDSDHEIQPTDDVPAEGAGNIEDEGGDADEGNGGNGE